MCNALGPPEFFPSRKTTYVTEAPPGTATMPMSDWLNAYNGRGKPELNDCEKALFPDAWGVLPPLARCWGYCSVRARSRARERGRPLLDGIVPSSLIPWTIDRNPTHFRALDTSAFDFDLPQRLIAQTAVEPRDAARLLVAGPEGGAAGAAHATVAELPERLRAGDLLVLNDTRVLPARVRASRSTGGKVEALFLEPRPGASGDARGTWLALVRPAKKIREGEALVTRDAGVQLVAVERDAASGGWFVKLVEAARPEAATEDLLERVGDVPLPPYIERDADAADLERYQTVYARESGAVAAPTAGLHFTPELLERIEARGVGIARVTLHVGAGTFRPVTAERIEDHRMHSERYALSAETAERVRRCKEAGGRVVAVGTTSARTLEACWDPASGEGARARVIAGRGETEIFLHPGSRPRVCDGLFTNFHLPKSSLIMLVAGFVGVEEVQSLYRLAVEREYRFYSYGDAMILERRASIEAR